MADKCITVVAGIVDDPLFAGLCYIAESLENSLPNFHFKRIPKNTSEWKIWLRQICIRYGWSHTKSPIVWREIGISGNKIKYIGGAYNFFKLLHKYYNIDMHLTNEDLADLQSDLLYAVQTASNVKPLEIRREYRRITIIGAGRSICPDLVPQLVTMPELWKLHGVIIKLYDEPGRYFKLKKIVKDVEATGGGLQSAVIIENIVDGLLDCDILIYLDTVLREEDEGIDIWLGRYYNSMEQLSTSINSSAPSDMKIICSSMGLSCFCVNILHKLVTTIPKHNIVATSAQYGLEILHTFVTSLGFDPREFGCPPVWGFLGINQFVDINHIVQKYDVCRVSSAAFWTNQQLAFRIKRPELRWLGYIAYNKNPYIPALERRAITQYQIGRPEDFQKCRAICDLLMLWHTKDREVDEIISLGIQSDGTFGIPKGLVFSQPVHLKVLDNDRRIWVPFAGFPLPDIPQTIFQNLIDTGVIVKNKFGV